MSDTKPSDADTVPTSAAARASARDLATALGVVGPEVAARVGIASALDDTEAALLRDAVDDLPDPIAPLARRLLDEWDGLLPVERTAGLLFLAEAFAGRDRGDALGSRVNG